MTVWFVSDARYPGGAETYLVWLLEALGNRSAGLIAVERPGLLSWIDAQQQKGFPVERLAPGGIISVAQRLQSTLRRHRPACVHVNMPGPYDAMLATLPAAARAAGVPRVVVTEHLPTVGRVGKRYLLKRLLVPAVSRAIAVCPEHGRVLTSVFGYSHRQVVAIPNGVPDPNPQGVVAAEIGLPLPQDLARCERGGGVRLMQVGALDHRKGGDVLLEAAARLHELGVAFQLWFVGTGPQKPAWARQAAEAGLTSRVHFAGARDDVHALWRAADVAVLASRREGLPLSLVEAMAHGLPVVASAVDGVVGLVRSGKTGTLVQPDDATALAWALAELAASPGRRVAFGSRGRRRYKNEYTLDLMLRRTLRELAA